MERDHDGRPPPPTGSSQTTNGPWSSPGDGKTSYLLWVYNTRQFIVAGALADSSELGNSSIVSTTSVDHRPPKIASIRSIRGFSPAGRFLRSRYVARALPTSGLIKPFL